MSDNIYSKNYDVRYAIDTFYCGVKCGLMSVLDSLQEINNYLSSKLFIKLENGKGNIYYLSSLVNTDNSVFIYFNTRLGCLNDDITIQLGGKFFVDYDSASKFIDFLFNRFDVNVQRCDVCMDICYIDNPLIDYDFTNNLGFPTPSIRKDYRYKCNGFKLYSRMYGKIQFVNMMSCGSKDVLLRVYDKELEVLEKKKMTYSDYYMTEKNYKKVYRIELQARGQTNKGFIEKIKERHHFLNAGRLIEYYLDYVFRKFEFKNVDRKLKHDEVHFSRVKKEKSLKEQYDYYKKMELKDYNKLCDIGEKIYYMQELDRITNIIPDDELVMDFYESYERLIKDTTL